MKSKHLLLMLLLALFVPWAANAQEYLTVYENETSTNSNVPVWGTWADNSLKCEILYPASELEAMAGGEISALKFYANSTSLNIGTESATGNWNGTFTIFMKEVEATTLSAFTDGAGAVTVLEGAKIGVVNGEMTIEFSDNYTYEGGNLLLGVYYTTGGQYKGATWYGKSMSGASIYGRSGQSYSASQGNFIPRTTFTYEPASGDCPNPKTFVASDVTAHGATVTWTMEDETAEYQFNLEFKKTTEEEWTRIGLGNVRTYPLTGLFAETEYQVRIQTACDPENDKWKNLNPNFTTEVACPAPTNLAVDPNSITAYEATATWEGTSESYVVSLGVYDFTATPTVINVEEGFESSMPTGWTHIGSGSAAPASPGSSHTHSGEALKFSGATSNNVVVLPEFEVEANMLTIDFWSKAEGSSSGSFDLGYVTDATDASTFVKLETYTSSDHSSYTHVENYSLAAVPAGARIAFRHSSGSSSWYWFIDDVTISGNVYPINWTDFTTTNQTYPFPSLTPNTPYQVKVKGNCGDEGYSQEAGPVSFTTLPSCFDPTGLTMVEGYPTAHGVSFTWDYESGEVFQFALVQGNLTEIEDANYNTVWNAGDNFPMWSTLSADTDWSFFLRKKCGDTDFSEAVYVNFHTLEACPAPTGFAAMPNSITAHTADLTWEGTSNSYQVAYRTAAYIDGTEEGFYNSPTGWLFRTGALNTDGTATLTGTSSWSRGNSNSVFDYHIYMNMYSHSGSKDYWLITPSMEINAGDALSLDMAYTAYSGTQAAPALNCTTHRFAILISTDDMATWTILREWNNNGTGTDVLDEVSSSGQTVSGINLSAYAGQTVYIAFFGHAETSSYDNNFHFDNVTIGTPVEAGEWQYKTVSEAPCQLTGLFAERKYEATLLGDCDNEGVSTVVGPINFTTGIACPAPTALNHANVKSNQVDLSWTNGGAENWVLAYKKTADAEFTELALGLNDVTIEGTTVTYTLTGLAEETPYTVKVADNCELTVAGDGQSAWTSPVSFTTMAACAVDNVTVSNIGHYTATVDWNGESNNGYTVKYREAAGIDGSNEAFSDSSIPSDWSLNYGLVDDVVSGSATLTTSGSYNWKMVTAASNVFNSNHVKLNIYGSGVRNWLVSPSFTLAANSTMSFDLAFTAYAYDGSSTSAASGTCVDDRFAVLIYADNAWHILREWNNEDGATYVYNNIATAGETVSDIDISEYYGKTVQFAFYGESTVINGDNDLHIDNVQIGLPVAAGEWQPVNANENTANLSQLTPGTKYDLTVVPNCDETLASEIQQFSTVSENQKWFITEGDWGTAANWEPEGAPTVDQTVELRANVTIESGCVALAKTINKGTYSITVEDGGQLKYYNNTAISATVKKNIAAWTIEESNDVELSDGWYLIANPITSNFTPTAENGFYAGNYDLYSWNYAATDGNEWLNFKVTSNSLTYLNSSNYNSYGYLYANEQVTVLTYEGNVKPANSNLYRSVTAPSTPSNYAFPGWFLMGNGYLCTAYVASASSNGEGKPYYRMNTDHNGFEAATAGTPLAPMEGFFYEATSTSSTSIYVTPNKPTVPSEGKLNMNLSKGNKQLDNAILVFGGEQQLGKMTFRANSSKVYMPVEGKDFAIISTESNVGEMPVNFKAEKNGNYTLSFNAEEVSFAYLHLIDNLTGVETDLLETPSYSFEAKTTDYASRFTLVFATGNNNEDNFAYFSNGNFVINNEGNATLQVVDVMGRIVKSQNINGCANVNVNAAPGVYMLRLVNGNDVKVQKVVVR